MTKIILTGGGTAGHIWPIIAISEVLKNNKKVKFVYVGSYGGQEQKIVRTYQIKFKAIFVGKHRNYFSILNFIDALKTFLGIIQSFFIILFFRPNIIFAKGGYVTIPMIFWARILKIPLVVHESDVVLGKANTLASKIAKKICLGFPLRYYPNLPLEKVVYTGTPVLKEFFQTLPVKSERPKILITGGSQGAHRINELILEILPELGEKYEVFHISGERDFAEINQKQNNFPNYHPIKFSDQMAKLMRDADLIVSRSGANTLAEISALGKPSILIPLSTAYLDHQSANARVYEENSAAVVLNERDLTGHSLLSIINRLMEDENLRNLLGHHAREFARREAAQEIVDVIFESL